MATSPPTLTEMIAALVETPSVSCVQPRLDMSNEPVVSLLANWLEDAGADVSVSAIPGHPGKTNLVARMGEGTDGLAIAGHTDTVPCDEQLWKHDPFRLTESGGRLYGLGTADMKAFLAIAVEALRRVERKALQRPLVLLATADEESSMLGAKAMVEAGEPLGRHAIIGEPTGLRPVRMHKGILMEAIRVRGQSGHSSDPDQGANALEAMHGVIADLMAWREQLAQRHLNTAFDVPFPTLNLGHIHGGDNPNRICGDCELHIDLRPVPGMDIQASRETLRDRVRNVLSDQDFDISFVPLFDGIPPMETSADAEIVRVAESLTGHTAGAVAFGTEGPYFEILGAETVILGPGDIALAHQPDEYLQADRIEPTVGLLGGMIRHFCYEN